MNRHALVRGWNAVLALAIVVAVAGQLALVVDRGGSIGNFFSYFTVESNLLVLLTACWLVADPAGSRGGDLWQMVRLAALTGITVTGVVYGTLIAPYNDPHGAEWLYDVLFHYVSPVLAVLAFLLLGPRSQLRRAHLWFIVWPLAWLAYTMVRAEISTPDFVGLGAARSSYPYGFLDVDAHGWGSVGAYIAGIAVLLLALAACYVWLDPRLGAGRGAALPLRAT